MRGPIRSSILLLALAASTLPPGIAQESAPTAATGVSDPLTRAVELAQEEDYSGAVALLEPLHERGEASPPARALLGALYLELGSHPLALEILQPLAELEAADPAVLYNTGRAALALGRVDLAEPFLERSVALVAGSPAARELGILRARQGRYFDAYRLLRPWVAGSPDDIEARRIAALAAVQLERPTEAEELLSDLSQDEPAVRILWGKLLLQKNDAFGAAATLRPLLETAPEPMQLDVRQTLADALMAMGEAASAVEVLEGYVGGNPSIALLLTLAQYQAGDLDGALATLEPYAAPVLERTKAGETQFSSLDGSLIAEYGRLMATAGRQAEALPYLEAASRIVPDRKLVWQQLGQALAAVGRRDEAREALARFQEIVQSEVPDALSDVQLDRDVQDPTGRQLRAAIEAMARNDIERALTLARREAELAPQDPRPLLVEVRILLVAGRRDEALSIAQSLAEALPQSADAHYVLGTAHMAFEDLDAAESAFRRALEIFPDHTASMNDLAVVLIERGDPDGARRLLERVLELRPGDELATSNLESLDGSGS